MASKAPNMPPLRRSDLGDDPIAQIGAWLERALQEVPLAEAMTLATVDESGEPDARMVLLKGVGPAGLRFFTDYESAKGRQLAAQPQAALIVYWRELDRQIRARGTVERLPEADSDEYFATRPRASRIAAWLSPQSEPIASHAELEQRFGGLESRFDGRDVERPPFWGGYVLRPQTVEFFQSQRNRLHDRFRYTHERSGWRIERLTP